MILNQTFQYYCRIDFDLLDAGGVVHHPKYFVLCERARSEALRGMGLSAEEFWKEGIAFAVVQTTAEFKKPLRWEMGYRILVQALEVGTSWMIVRHLIEEWNGEPFAPSFLERVEPSKLCFQADLKLVTVRLDRFRAVRLPHRLLERMGVVQPEQTQELS